RLRHELLAGRVHPVWHDARRRAVRQPRHGLQADPMPVNAQQIRIALDYFECVGARFDADAIVGTPLDGPALGINLHEHPAALDRNQFLRGHDVDDAHHMRATQYRVLGEEQHHAVLKSIACPWMMTGLPSACTVTPTSTWTQLFLF